MYITSSPSLRQRQARDRILEAQLRPDPSPFTLNQEFPIVLDSQRNGLSYHLVIHDEVVAHANFWPRRLESTALNSHNRSSYRVALIGNVATAQAHQGKGYMSCLLSEIETIARKKSIQALMLWSDLLQFYQKQKFRSFGLECRLNYSSGQAIEASPSYLILSPQDIDEAIIARWLVLRPDFGFTLQRSRSEFKKMLTIPGMTLGCYHCNGQIEGFAIMGKGVDMQGVVHEWGGEPEKVVALSRHMAFRLGLPQVTILVPQCLIRWPAWQHLKSQALSSEKHPMALCKWLSEDPHIDDRCFIWGLDSI